MDQYTRGSDYYAYKLRHHTTTDLTAAEIHQLGLAELSQPIAKALAQKNDLGLHTEILTEYLMDLVAQGVITNRHKSLDEGKLVASGAIGSQQFYQSLHNNVIIDFRPSDYVNNPAVIAQNHKILRMRECMNSLGTAWFASAI